MKLQVRQVILCFTALASSALAIVTVDGSGRVPVMGWNHYNAYGDAIDQDKFLGTATQLIQQGYKDIGYQYVNFDDGWQQQYRDNTTIRMIPNFTKFPLGMDGIANKIHGMGLKFGLYSDAGTGTCGQRPASLYYEEIDAGSWAEWGADYVKVDNCNIPDTWTQDLYNGCHPDYDHPWGYNATCADTTRQAPDDFDWTKSSQAKRYKRLTNALQKQNRTILLSICNWGQAKVERWGNETGSSWRITDDISADWIRIKEILNYSSFKLSYVNFWGHNDMDLLQVGNGNLSLAEQRSHFALWAALKSPLLISTPLENLSQNHVAILQNKYLTQFNQDSQYGEPAQPYKWGINPNWTFNKTNPAEYYAGPSTKGTLVLMFNPLNTTENKTANWAEYLAFKQGHLIKS